MRTFWAPDSLSRDTEAEIHHQAVHGSREWIVLVDILKGEKAQSGVEVCLGEAASCPHVQRALTSVLQGCWVTEALTFGVLVQCPSRQICYLLTKEVLQKRQKELHCA